MCTMNRQLAKLLQNPQTKTIEFDNTDKFILFSDIHRGVNDWSDDFAHNQLLLFHALDVYLNDGFTCIEVGDSDELWENKKFDDIRYQHSQIFWRLKHFYDQGRFHMIYGNHDIVKKKKSYVEKNLWFFLDRRAGLINDLLKDIIPDEAIKLNYKPSGTELLVLHGHQSDWFCNHFWWLARFFVRYLWKWLQNLGLRDRTSAAQNFKKAKKLDAKMEAWTRDNAHWLIAGHTHRSRLVKDSKYVNTGSCVHPRCISGTEIENGKLTLIKWWKTTDKNGHVVVEREVIEGPVSL